MRTSRRTVRLRQSRLMLGIGALGCLMGAAEAGAAISPEFESLHAAIVAQDKDAALAFISRFPSSPLADDLIAMLPPAVAQGVCADLPSGAARAEAACRKSDMRVGIHDPGGGNPILADKDGDAGAGALGLSPAAGAARPARGLATARSRPAGATGERALSETAMVLPPSLEDGPAAPEDDKPAAKAARKEPPAAPKRHREPAPPAPTPGLGSDPGSDPGAATMPSSFGSDPGSDPKGQSKGDDGRDSHP